MVFDIDCTLSIWSNYSQPASGVIAVIQPDLGWKEGALRCFGFPHPEKPDEATRALRPGRKPGCLGCFGPWSPTCHSHRWWLIKCSIVSNYMDLQLLTIMDFIPTLGDLPAYVLFFGRGGSLDLVRRLGQKLQANVAYVSNRWSARSIPVHLHEWYSSPSMKMVCFQISNNIWLELLTVMYFIHGNLPPNMRFF